jgi:hypothetical protein
MNGLGAVAVAELESDRVDSLSPLRLKPDEM